MSSEPTDESGFAALPVDRVETTAVKPRAHGASVANVLNDLAPSRRDERPGDRETLYDTAVSYWRENVADYDVEPYPAVEDFQADWLPETSGRWALVVKSSKWKAGRGIGNSYSPFYEQHIMLREAVENDDGETELRKPPLALHVEIMPQYRDLVYSSGDPLQCPYGEGTRVVAWTTWAESAEAVETRMFDAVRAVYGDEAVDVALDRNPDSRRIQKAEAHVRFAREKKSPVVETVEQSKALIDWGGDSEIVAHQKRQQEGWLEARVEADRWHLLGFDDREFSTELKVYQASGWHKKPDDDPFAHPKLEASFAGVDRGKLPHADEWDDVLQHLRTVVSTHTEWAGVERADMVEDDFFDGPLADEWVFGMPKGRREHLRARYEDRATDVYREALKESTVAVYDVLRVIARNNGATYDYLEEHTGLARSTIRYHVARLAEAGVVKRLGNPVLVVFVSRALLERAREILETARPGRTVEDMVHDAEERRERREHQRDDAEDDDRDRSDETDRGGDDVGGDDLGFRYLAELREDLVDIVVAYDGDVLDDEDIRIREDPLRDPPS